MGPVGYDGLGLCSTEHLSLPAEPGLPSELNRKMTKWWQRNGCQFQVDITTSEDAQYCLFRWHFNNELPFPAEACDLKIWFLSKCPGIHWFLELQGFTLGKNFDDERPSWKLWDWFGRDKKFLKKVSRIPRFQGECWGKNTGLIPEDWSISLHCIALWDLGQITLLLWTLASSSIKWGRWIGSIIFKLCSEDPVVNKLEEMLG